MYNAQPRTPRGQIAQNELANTPEHLRPGFSGQPVRQYDPRDFGLTGNEEWRNPCMFRNMTYDTDADARQRFHQLHSERPGYCLGTPITHLSNLPEQCLADVSEPTFEHLSGENLAETPLGGNEARDYVDSLYREIVHRFQNLRERIERGDNILPSEASHASGNVQCPMQSDAPQVHTSQKVDGNRTTLRKVTTHRDQRGNITKRVEETSTVSNAPNERTERNLDYTPTAGPTGGPGRHLNFSIPDNTEHLEDISVPLFYDDYIPAMSTRIAPQSMPSECLADTSSPSFADPAGRSIQVPARNISNILAPSFGTNICLEDVSAPSFPRSPGTQDASDISAPSYASSNRGATTNECLENITMPSGISETSGVSRHQATPLSTECLDNVTMPSFAGVSGSSNRQTPCMPSECLDDISAPSFGRSMSRNTTPRRQERSMPSNNICDISAPSFGSSGRAPTNNQFLEDASMPSYGTVSSALRTRTPTRQQQSVPSQNICDISAPSFGSSGRMAMNNECLEDITMPSFGGVSGSSRRQQTMPSECLNDIGAPSFGRNMSRGADLQRQAESIPSPNICNISAPSFRSTGRRLNDEFLENETMPSFGGVSGVSGRQETCMLECLDEISAPSFQRSLSRSRTPRQRAHNICDITAPSFSSSGREPATTEFLEDISKPSFGGISGSSRARSPTRQQQSMPSQNRSRHAAMTNECLEDITMPSFGGVSDSSRRQQTMPSECLDDISAPSFGRNMSRGASRGKQDQTMPSQNIYDTSAPSFGSTGRRPVTNERLENITMPSLEDISGASNRQENCMFECLDDISAPSFGRNMSRNTTPRRRQRGMPSQNICDISAPLFGSSGRGPATNEFLEDISKPSFGGISGSSRARSPTRQPQSMPSQNRSRHAAMTNECLEDITMPSFGGVSGSSRRQQPMPSECLDDISAPSFGRNMSRGASRGKQDQTMPSQNIYDTSAPSFGSTGRRPATNERLENITMPSFGGISGTSKQQESYMPSECLNDISAPFFGQNMSRSRTPQRQEKSMPSKNICDISAGPATNEFLEDISKPLFGGISGSSRARSPTRQPQSMPSQNRSRHAAMTNECLEDITMPSFGGVSGSSRRQQTMPLECLDDISAPSFGRNMSRGASRGKQDQTMPSQNIYDTSSPSFGSTGRRPATNERLENITMPSFGGISGTSKQQESYMPSECLNDISAPSFGQNMSLSRTPQLQERSMPSHNISDISAPSFGCSSRGPASRSPTRQQQSIPSQNRSRHAAMTNECLEDITMPSFGGVSGSSRRQQTMPSECLDDISAPSFGRNMSRGASRGKQDQTMPSQNIYDTSSPSFGSTGRRPATNERLENITMPSFGGISGTSKQQESYMPSECLNDISAPSFGQNMSRSRTPQRQEKSMPSHNICDISAPSFGSSGRGHTTNEFLEDISMPSFEGVSGSSKARTPRRQQQAKPSQKSYDTSAPAQGRGGPMTKEYLDNITMPSFGDISESPRRLPGTKLSQGTRNRYQQRSLPSPNGRVPMTNEFLENITMPSYVKCAEVSGTAPSHRYQEMTSEYLNDVSPPSFGRNTTRSTNQNTEQLCDISPPGLQTMSSSSRRARPDPTYLSECLNDVTMPSMQGGTPLRRVHSFPCVSSQQQIGEISAPSMGSPMHAFSDNLRSDNMTQRRPPDMSYPSNLYATCYANCMIRSNQNASEASRKRSRSLPWAEGTMVSNRDRHENNQEKATAPSSFEKCASREYMASSRNYSRPHEQQLADISVPTLASTGHGQRTNFGHSTNMCIEDVSSPTGMDSQFSKSQTHLDKCETGLDSSMQQQKEDESNKCVPLSYTQKISKELADESEPSLINNCTEEPGIVVKEVHEVIVKTSSIRVYANNNMGEDNRIEDISMPQFESTGHSSTGPTQRTNGFLADVSEPTFGPSFQSNQQSSTGPNDTFHGFDSMDNYAPFDELIASTPQSKISQDANRTPEPVRGDINVNSQKADPLSGQNTPCICKGRLQFKNRDGNLSH